MKKTLILLLSAGILVLGCSKSEPAAPAVASAAPVAAPVAPVASVAPDPAAAAVDSAPALNAAAPVAAAPAAAAKAVPTEADYEVEAESKITPTNAAQVLAAIDAQVGK